MKQHPISIQSVILISVLFISLSAAKLLNGQGRKAFFNDSDLMLVGSYYYPEHWPRNNWERDLRKMSELGFEFTHFGEFAWSQMEPEEGKYDFSWLDEAVRLAEKYKLKVIMCTPTPTPPAWLSEKYPDILMENEDGRTMRHGSRQHISWSSPRYRDYVEKIVTELAKRYGKNEAIWGWQIDNEPSHYASGYDYSDNATRSFRKWLKNKYKTIDKLNISWGNSFWSLNYDDFDQIRIPNPKELVQQPNPHAILDFRRFTADEVADFVIFQKNVLRKYISEKQWVTTNLMAEDAVVDPQRMGDLDFLTYTKYLVKGDMGLGEQGFRIGSNLAIAYSNDFLRPVTGVVGVMELQPGQVNWGRFNPQTYPGAVRMWIFHAFAGGNKFVCNYRFRQPLFGGEQYHYGILQPDGVNVSRPGMEYVEAIREIALLKKSFAANVPVPKSYASKKTAILYNADNRWETENQPQTFQWSFMGHIRKYYKILKSFGAPVDIIDERADFTGYPFMIAPSYQLLDDEIVARWKKYVEQGGHLILTCRTGQKNRDAQLWEAKFAKPIYQLIGAEELFFDHLPANLWAGIQMDGRTYSWNNWADVLVPAANTNVWAVYNDQYYKGNAAVLSNRLGKGTVTFIGPDTDDAKLEKDVLLKVYQQAGIQIDELPEGMVLEWRDGFWVCLNYSSEKRTAPVPGSAKILIGEKELLPAGVTVWME
jgi:beta-galactosidase